VKNLAALDGRDYRFGKIKNEQDSLAQNPMNPVKNTYIQEYILAVTAIS
jgi:hypothetical protein